MVGLWELCEIYFNIIFLSMPYFSSYLNKTELFNIKVYFFMSLLKVNTTEFRNNPSISTVNILLTWLCTWLHSICVYASSVENNVYDKQKEWLLELLLLRCFSLSCVARHNILTNQKIFSYGFGPPYEGQKNGNVPMSLSNN